MGCKELSVFCKKKLKSFLDSCVHWNGTYYFLGVANNTFNKTFWELEIFRKIYIAFSKRYFLLSLDLRDLYG